MRPIFLFLLVLISNICGAENSIEKYRLESEKNKIVSRTYEMSYGSIDRCGGAHEYTNQAFHTQLYRFAEKYKNYMQLVKSSPYYELARKRLYKYKLIDPKVDTVDSLTYECQAMVELLRASVDDPEGPAAIKEMEDILMQK